MMIIKQFRCSHRFSRFKAHTATLSPIYGYLSAVSGLQRRCVYYSTSTRRYATHNPPDPNDSFLHENVGTYMDDMYMQWKQSPDLVHASWRSYFENIESGRIPPSKAFQAPPGLISDPRTPIYRDHRFQPVQLVKHKVTEVQTLDVSKHLKVQLMVRAYQARGHEKADIDPLGLRGQCPIPDKILPSELEPSHYGFSKEDMGLEFGLGSGILSRFISAENPYMKLEDIVATCEAVYCGTIGVEYLHVADRAKCEWIRDRIEVPNRISFSTEEKKQILDRLIWSALFEKFLATKFPTEKRYGVEGGESLNAGVKAMIDASVEYGVENIVIGSQHRGRLGMMANVVRKPLDALLYEFSSGASTAHADESGDVKTHLGMNYTRTYPSGRSVNISLLANPSHLEAEDPVAAGKAKAMQHFGNDKSRSKTMCFTLHGDAAIAGQGVVYETLGLCNLPAFSTGGTVHFIVNNQIGFTTDPQYSRSTAYCSDIAKSADAPIFHVNADDVEAVTFVSKLAADWRAEFKSDVFVDLVCYRKHGHNEMDQPMFTQPYMYERIAQKRPTLDIYIDKLIDEGVISQEEADRMQDHVWKKMMEGLEASKIYQPKNDEWLTSTWPKVKSPREVSSQTFPPQSTAIDEVAWNTVTEKISKVPDNFETHRNVQRVLDTRKQALDEGRNIDWSTAEALAFGSLCMEGYHIRVSGEDVERGTFSQRHAVVHNQKFTPDNGQLQKWCSLDNLTQDQGRFSICNSPLGEYGVLGFEYGYSVASSDALVMWEAQFGDFVNTAQVIIDNFLSSGEAKWLQRSGLVLSLPHGYDGQGPEHSSARLERFLQLCNEDARYYPSSTKLQRLHQDCNIQVVYPTTPANLFHVLRRQLHRDFRKPLIIFFSKSLLRHQLTKSPKSAFTHTSHFQHLIPDTTSTTPPAAIRKILLCTGQIYATLQIHRVTYSHSDVAITRLEQLHPFPWSQLKENLDQYPNAEEVMWVQEEPMNGGAWSYVQARIETVLEQTKWHRGKKVVYRGRDPSAATAVGYKARHREEERRLLSDIFGEGREKMSSS